MKKKFTALVVARTGKVSAVQPGKGTWGKKECPPIFELVELEATPEEAEWFKQRGRYQDGKFVDREDGQPFDEKTDVIEDETYDENLQRCEQLATGLNNGAIPELPCHFLRAGHLGKEVDDRVYWLRRFFPFRKEKGVKALLKAVKKGLYPDTREAFRAMDEETQNKLLENMSPEDRMYMEWLGKTEVS